MPRAFHAAPPAYGKVIPFLLADIGEGIKECEVLAWHVNVGDRIQQFDKVCEVQSDKATVEITSRYDGVVSKLHYAVGAMAQVGTPLIDITVEADDRPDPLLDGRLDARDRDRVLEQQTAAAPASAAPASAAPASAAPAAAAAPPHSAEPSGSGKVFATPAVRRVSREFSVDLDHVVGTGKDGRVLKEDVVAFVTARESGKIAAAPTPKAAAPAGKAAHAPAPVFVPVRAATVDTEVPIRGMTRTMFKTMAASVQIPSFGYMDEIEMDALIAMRRDIKPTAERLGLKVSFMPIFIKAASVALLEFPSLNASINADQSALIYKARHNIGFAMDTPLGLVVPNIKDVQAKSIFEISAEMQRLIDAGGRSALQAVDLTDGTFTLSNVGSIGGTYTMPVVLSPEVCIGGLGKMQTLPRYDASGNLVPRSIVNVSWSADHRVIDGATMARFSNLWKEMLQSPVLLAARLR